MANESSKSDNTHGLTCELLASLEVDREEESQEAIGAGFERTFSGMLLKGRLHGTVRHGVVKLKLGPGRNLIETHARLTIITDDGAEVMLDDRAEWRGKEDALVRFLTRTFLGVAEAYLIGIVRFEVTDPRYAWLKSANVLSHGAMHGSKVRIEFFQLTEVTDIAKDDPKQLLLPLRKESSAP